MARPDQTMRECALTRTAMPATDLLRFALGPDGHIVPDVDGKAPGRGVWITLSEKAVGEAQNKKVFAKSLKQAVGMPADLALLARSRLEQRLLGALGLARKAGQLLMGAGKVRDAIGKGEITALLTATDAAPDGRQKMVGALRTHAGPQIPHFELLTSDQLGLALGQQNVIHAALTKGAAANAALARAERLSRYRDV